jgi:hypothetical protein
MFPAIAVIFCRQPDIFLVLIHTNLFIKPSYFMLSLLIKTKVGNKGSEVHKTNLCLTSTPSCQWQVSAAA